MTVQTLLSLSGERPDADLRARFAGVGLIRGEYLLRSHEQYVTVADCQARMAAYLDEVAQAFWPDPVWYRTTELTSDEANTLAGVDVLLTEADPMKGMRGLRRGLAYPDAFRTELKVVAEVARQRPNLHVLLPFVMDADEFGRGLDLLAAEQWPNKVGSMIEIPSAVLDVPRFVAAGAECLLLGFNDLSALLTGASRATHDTKLHPAVWNAVAQVRDSVSEGFRWGVGGNLTPAVLERARAENVPFVTLHYSELVKLLGIAPDRLPDRFFVNSTKIKTRSQISAARLRAVLAPYDVVVP